MRPYKRYVAKAMCESLANQCGFTTWEEYSNYLLKGKRNIETHAIDTETSLISKELRIDD